MTQKATRGTIRRTYKRTGRSKAARKAGTTTKATKRETESEVLITRIFDAPRQRVWKAWTEPEEVRKWWAPKGFSAPHIRIDFRVGGKFVYCMRGAGFDGAVKDFWNTGHHLEIVPM